jgi:PAS domain S-box-containing protein
LKLDTLGTWIGLLAAVAVIPVAGVSVWALHRDTQRATAEAYEKAHLLAAGTARALEWELEDGRSTLEALAEEPRVRALDPKRCESLFAEFAPFRPFYVTLSLRRRDGSLVCSTLQNAASQAATQAAPWFQDALGSDGFAVSDAYQGTVTGHWTSVLTMPVRDGTGATAGVLIMPLNLDAFAPRLFRETESSALVVVIGRDLRVLMRSKLHAERVGKPIPPRFAEAFAQQANQPFEQIGVEGERRLYTTVVMPGTGWRIVGAWPAEAIMAPRRAERQAAAFSIATVVLLSIALGSLVMRRTLRPLRNLSDTLASIGDGEWSARATPSGPRELRHLAERLNETLDARQRAQSALADSEARFRALTQLSSDWYWEQDAEFRFTEMSAGVDRFTPIRSAGHIGHTRWELPYVEMSEEDWARHRAVLARHEPFRDFDLRRPGVDGQTHYMLISGTPIFDGEGRFTGYRGVGRDVTEVRRAQEALGARERSYRQLIEELPAGVVVHGADTAIQLCNAEACRVLGMTADQMAGRQAQDPAWRLLDENGTPLALDDFPVMRVLHTRQPLRGTVIGVQPSLGAAITWLLVRGFPELDAAGQLQRAVIVFIDITLQRQAQELRAERQRAEAADQATTAMLSRMSHELRTPLNAVLGFSQLMAMESVIAASPRAAKQLDYVTRAGEQLLALVNDILDVARLQSGTMRVELQQTALVPLLEDCIAMQHASAARAEVTVGLQAADPSVAVWADPTRLTQVVANLVSNAIKYNRPGGRVDLEVEQSGEQVRVHVADTGEGLTDEQMATLFVAFNRLGAERRGIQGTGLGLVISRDLMHAMNGDLAVRSRVGEGTTFTIRLRRALALPAPAGTPAAAATAPDAAAAHVRPLRVLYIEDNAVNADLMRSILAQRHDVVLEHESSGLAGVARAQASPHDLLLVDIGLPDIDGLEVLRRLCEMPALSGTRFVAVSANAIAADIDRARAAGFDDYVTKPFAVADLMRLIDRVKADLGRGA